MSHAPLIDVYGQHDVLAWEADGPRSVGEFLSDVAALADSLPDVPSVLNVLSSRYEFLVGFGAAMMRGQVTLLPQSRAPQTLRPVDWIPAFAGMTSHGSSLHTRIVCGGRCSSGHALLDAARRQQGFGIAGVDWTGREPGREQADHAVAAGALGEV